RGWQTGGGCWCLLRRGVWHGIRCRSEVGAGSRRRRTRMAFKRELFECYAAYPSKLKDEFRTGGVTCVGILRKSLSQNGIHVFTEFGIVAPRIRFLVEDLVHQARDGFRCKGLLTGENLIHHHG